MLLHPAWAWRQQQLLAASVQQELQSRKCQELSHKAGNLPQVLLPARGRPHQPHSSAGGGLGIRVRKSQGLASGFHCRAGNYLECFFVCYFLPFFFFFFPHEHLLDIKPCVNFPTGSKTDRYLLWPHASLARHSHCHLPTLSRQCEYSRATAPAAPVASALCFLAGLSCPGTPTCTCAGDVAVPIP